MSASNSVDLLDIDAVFGDAHNYNNHHAGESSSLNAQVTPKKTPPRIQIDLVNMERDEVGIFSPNKTKATPGVKLNATNAEYFPDTAQGMVLGRVSTRSLLVPFFRDWTPFYYVIMMNGDIRYYEDKNFLRYNSPDDYSILIYRERRDFENNAMGKGIKKVIPIRPNYYCGEVKKKSYPGEYGELYYFVLEELSEMKNFPIAKFASNNRTDIELMWMNLKCRIASAKKRQIESLVGI